jgi:hypothetical protein
MLKAHSKLMEEEEKSALDPINALSKLIGMSKTPKITMKDNMMKEIKIKYKLFFPNEDGKSIYPFTAHMNDQISHFIVEIVAASETFFQIDGKKPLTEAIIGVIYCTQELLYSVLIKFKGMVDIKMLECIAITCLVISIKYTWGDENLVYDGQIIEAAADITDERCSEKLIKSLVRPVLQLVNYRICPRSQEHIGNFENRKIKTRSQQDKPKRTKRRTNHNTRSKP